MPIPIVQVDAFTDRPFGGNPAAVCLLPRARDAEWMQNVAQEMNLSETAFLVKNDSGFDLRWFTPTVEVELCGHATLASAHALWELGVLAPEQQARFDTQSGVLTVRRSGDWIEMDFPATPPEPAQPPEGLEEALGVGPAGVHKSRFDLLLELDSEEAVRGVKPDFVKLAALTPRGVIVTARASSKPYDFVSRFFAPAAGINEDPVTGSAHCTLGPYWQKKLGRAEFLAYQASQRGGVVRVRPSGQRVLLAGQAVTVMQGELRAD